MNDIERVINDFLEKLEGLAIYPNDIMEKRFKTTPGLLDDWVKYSEIIYKRTLENRYLKAYPKACEIVEIKYSQLMFELNIYIEYYFKIIEELGVLPNSNMKLENGMLLKDFVVLNYQKIYETANNSCYQKKYPKACTFIKSRNEKTIIDINDEYEVNDVSEKNHKEKISERDYEIVKDRFNLIENRFNNGVKVTLSNFFDKRYLWYKYIEILKVMVLDEEISNKYPKTCKFVKLELNIKIGKLEEYLQVIEELEKIPLQSQDIYFSNGKKMNQYFKDNKDYIYAAIKTKKYQRRYPKACSIIEYRMNKNLKLEEFLQMVTDENNIITRRNVRLFKDMTSASVYWEEYKYDIFNAIDSTNYKHIYPVAYQIIKDSINNIRKLNKAKIEFTNDSKFSNVKNNIGHRENKNVRKIHKLC